MRWVDHSVWLWKHIRRGWTNFSQYILFADGDHFKIKFWKDLLCGDWIIKEAHPAIYGVTWKHEALVAKLMDLSSSSPQQNVTFLSAAWSIHLHISSTLCIMVEWMEELIRSCGIYPKRRDSLYNCTIILIWHKLQVRIYYVKKWGVWGSPIIALWCNYELVEWCLS